VSRQQKPSRQVSVDEQIQVVLAGLKGELSLAEAARRHGVSSATVGNWRDRFVDAGKAGMDRSLPGPDGGQSQTERRLRPRVRAAEARSRGGDGAAVDLAERLGVRRRCTFADLEALRAAHGVSVSRFAALAGIPERTYWRRLARHRVGDPPKGPWPSPRRLAARMRSVASAGGRTGPRPRRPPCRPRRDGRRRRRRLRDR
jgi:transposase-like protein